MADFQIDVQVDDQELQKAFDEEYQAGYDDGWNAGYDAGYLAADSYIQYESDGAN